MIAALVQFTPASPRRAAKMTVAALVTVPIYDDMPGLFRWYYVSTNGGYLAGGIYLWESQQAGDAVYIGEWRERVTAALSLRADGDLLRHTRGTRQPPQRNQKRTKCCVSCCALSWGVHTRLNGQLQPCAYAQQACRRCREHSARYSMASDRPAGRRPFRAASPAALFD